MTDLRVLEAMHRTTLGQAQLGVAFISRNLSVLDEKHRKALLRYVAISRGLASSLQPKAGVGVKAAPPRMRLGSVVSIRCDRAFFCCFGCMNEELYTREVAGKSLGLFDGCLCASQEHSRIEVILIILLSGADALKINETNLTESPWPEDLFCLHF